MAIRLALAEFISGMGGSLVVGGWGIRGWRGHSGTDYKQAFAVLFGLLRDVREWRRLAGSMEQSKRNEGSPGKRENIDIVPLHLMLPGSHVW